MFFNQIYTHKRTNATEHVGKKLDDLPRAVLKEVPQRSRDIRKGEYKKSMKRAANHFLGLG